METDDTEAEERSVSERNEPCYNEPSCSNQYNEPYSNEYNEPYSSEIQPRNTRLYTHSIDAEDRKRYWKFLSADKSHLVLGRFKRSFAIVHDFHHPHIITHYALVEAEYKGTSGWRLSMENAEMGSLHQLLRNREAIYTMRTVIKWSGQLFSALLYLKQKGFVHRDVSPANVLLSAGFQIKLTDFETIHNPPQAADMISMAGADRYIAPESYPRTEDYEKIVTFGSDLYSTGLLIYEIIERRCVLLEFGEEGMFDGDRFAQEVDRREYSPARPGCQHRIGDLVLRCIAVEPNDRPKIEEAITELNGLDQAPMFEFRPAFRQNEKRLLLPIGYDGGHEEMVVTGSDEISITFDTTLTPSNRSSQRSGVSYQTAATLSVVFVVPQVRRDSVSSTIQEPTSVSIYQRSRANSRDLFNFDRYFRPGLDLINTANRWGDRIAEKVCDYRRRVITENAFLMDERVKEMPRLVDEALQGLLDLEATGFRDELRRGLCLIEIRLSLDFPTYWETHSDHFKWLREASRRRRLPTRQPVDFNQLQDNLFAKEKLLCDVYRNHQDSGDRTRWILLSRHEKLLFTFESDRFEEMQTYDVESNSFSNPYTESSEVSNPYTGTLSYSADEKYPIDTDRLEVIQKRLLESLHPPEVLLDRLPPAEPAYEDLPPGRREPKKLLPKLKKAGAVLCAHYSPLLRPLIGSAVGLGTVAAMAYSLCRWDFFNPITAVLFCIFGLIYLIGIFYGRVMRIYDEHGRAVVNFFEFIDRVFTWLPLFLILMAKRLLEAVRDTRRRLRIKVTRF